MNFNRLDKAPISALPSNANYAPVFMVVVLTAIPSCVLGGTIQYVESTLLTGVPLSSGPILCCPT